MCMRDAASMGRAPLLPLFAVSVVTVVAAVIGVLATGSWWAMGVAFAMLLGMLALVASQVVAYLREQS